MAVRPRKRREFKEFDQCQTLLYGKFEMPEKIKIEESTATMTYARFIAEPFERGLDIP